MAFRPGIRADTLGSMSRSGDYGDGAASEKVHLGVHVAGTASVSGSAVIGAGARIWDLAQVREDAIIGEDCIIGRGAYIGVGVRIGRRSKVQNDALIYEPAEIGEGVFIGPAVVLTNDTYPRAINPDGSQKGSSDWQPVGVQIGQGAAIGARAVCVAPARVGRWATVAAGAVVTKNVLDFALVAGVPARQIGWVGKAGRRLNQFDGWWVCPDTGERYREGSTGLEEEHAL